MNTQAISAPELAALKAYANANGVPFDETKDRIEFRHYYNLVTFAVTLDTDTDVLNSSVGTHTLGEAGCNLPQLGQLEDRESCIITRLWALPDPVGYDATIHGNIVKLFGMGYTSGFFVGTKDLVLRNRKLAFMAKRTGLQPLTAGEGLGAAVLQGAAGLDNGYVLELPDRIAVGAGKKMKWNVRYNHGSAISATVKVWFGFDGWVISHG